MPRFWFNRQEDSKTFHCFGNGHFLIYEAGPNLMQMQGPPYTMPSFGSISFSQENTGEITCESIRLPETNIWYHKIQTGSSDERFSEFTDYMLSDQNLFFRDYAVTEPLILQLEHSQATFKYFFKNFSFGEVSQDCLMVRMPKGTVFFSSQDVEEESWLLLTVENGEITEDGKILLTGEGRLILSAGSLPDAVKYMSSALVMTAEEAQTKVKDYWNHFLAGITDLGAMLPDNLYEKELKKQASEACESVAILVKCQQSVSGGVIAGHFYPMAFVRDMAGTMRGMLSLGMKEEARKILTFLNQRFMQFGNVHNAEGMGNFGGRHCYPNDEAEVPAYLIVSAFWYVDKTGDAAILEEIYPMLKWAFEIQLPQLGGGMIGFSGDETYIAGGILPKVHIYDGSAEATLLFIEGGERFLSWCESHCCSPCIATEKMDEYKRIVQDTKAHYRDNFCIEGRIYVNNPARLDYVKKPPFEWGFCQLSNMGEHGWYWGWLLHDENSDYYCCPECYGKEHPQPFDRKKRYQLSSASLLPAFYESRLFSEQEMERFSAPYVDLFEKNGFVPSDANGSRSLGYDYGLFLYTMSVQKHELRVPALKAMLKILDETGSWVEYYDNGKPFNCRCRPWESAINIDALRKLVDSYDHLN